MVLARGWTFGLIVLHVARTGATCYNPDGSEAKNDLPCFPNQANSTCCGTGLACLSNNLCGITQFSSDPKRTFGLGESFVRGSCTEKSFTNPACLNRCLRGVTGDLYNVYVPVRQCLSGNKDRWYCSNPQTRAQSLDEVCFSPSKTDEYLFQMEGNPSTVTVIRHPTGTATEASNLPSATITNQSLRISTNPPSPTNTPAGGHTPESKTPDYSIPIGVGVGVPLGLSSTAILLFLYLRHRRNAAATKEHLHEKEAPDSQSSIYVYRAELSDRSRAGELPANPDRHELSAGVLRDESSVD